MIQSGKKKKKKRTNSCNSFWIAHNFKDYSYRLETRCDDSSIMALIALGVYFAPRPLLVWAWRSPVLRTVQNLFSMRWFLFPDPIMYDYLENGSVLILAYREHFHSIFCVMWSCDLGIGQSLHQIMAYIHPIQVVTLILYCKNILGIQSIIQ